jgi:hypothetical protein
MFGIAKNAGAPSNTQIFDPSIAASGLRNQIWKKPPNASMVYFFLVGAGAGGGGGARGLSTSGGAGGASGNIVTFSCLASVLPNQIYMQVPFGGQGGAGGVVNVGSAGGVGVSSQILFSRTNVLPNAILNTGGNNPGGGNGGSSGASTAGTVPSVGTILPFNQLGQWSTKVGIVGTSGGVGIAGADATAWVSIPLSGGASGGGISSISAVFNGGSVAATALTDLGTAGYYNTIVAQGGIASTTRVDGSAGKKSITPFMNSGGAGGASSTTIGGNGGDGGYGCGGGGGGAGITAGGQGGNGGDGLIIITWI